MERTPEKKITVLYDADCAFCALCRDFVLARQRSAFEFRDIADHNAPSIIVEPDTLALTKFSACLYIARHMRQPWPTTAAVLGVLPERLGDWGYNWGSRHRGLLMKLFRR